MWVGGDFFFDGIEAIVDTEGPTPTGTSCQETTRRLKLRSPKAKKPAMNASRTG